MQVVPGYVFTRNGADYVTWEEVGQLTTRKVARERNQQVLNHLLFWAWFFQASGCHICLPCGEQRFVFEGDYIGGMAGFGIPRDRKTTTEIVVAAPDIDWSDLEDGGTTRWGISTAASSAQTTHSLDPWCGRCRRPPPRSRGDASVLPALQGQTPLSLLWDSARAHHRWKSKKGSGRSSHSREILDEYRSFSPVLLSVLLCHMGTIYVPVHEVCGLVMTDEVELTDFLKDKIREGVRS